MASSQPHTLSWLAVMLALLLPIFLHSSATTPPEQDLRTGLFACSLVFLFYCCLQLQDGELTRPHVVVWRLVHGITILYLLFIVLLLSQSSNQMVDNIVRLTFNESDAGTALLPRFEMNDYSANCSLQWENVKPRIFDRYFAAHLFGWIGKALILRDWQMMWACSLLFEVFEITLQRLMPNFSECWWDRWGLDVFGCNLLGMVIGMRLALVLGAQEYDWQGQKRWMKYASPKVFPKRFAWHVFASWRHFGIALLVLFVVMLGELNGFFIKSALRLGNQSWLILWRILFIVPAVYASVVELYAFAEKRTEVVGRTAWLVVCLGVLEFMLAMKNFYLRQAFSPEQLMLERPVLLAWTGSLAFACLILILKLTKLCTTQQVRLVGKLAVFPFAYLLVYDAWEWGGLKHVWGS